MFVPHTSEPEKLKKFLGDNDMYLYTDLAGIARLTAYCRAGILIRYSQTVIASGGRDSPNKKDYGEK
jgi:hypothetical protein